MMFPFKKVSEGEANKKMLLACFAGRASKVHKYIFKNGANPACTDANGDSGLHLACDKLHEEVAVLLVKEVGVDVNAQNNNGETALHTAAQRGSLSLLELLLDNNSNPTIPDNNGTTPLHHAAARGSQNIVEKLLECGADPEAVDGHDQMPLHLAAYAGHTAVVSLLLASRQNLIDAVTDLGESPLHLAVSNGHMGVVEVLLKHNPNITLKRSTDGMTPLHIAVERRDYSLVSALSLHGGPSALDASDMQGRSPLDLAGTDTRLQSDMRRKSSRISSARLTSAVLHEDAELPSRASLPPSFHSILSKSATNVTASSAPNQSTNTNSLRLSSTSGVGSEPSKTKLPALPSVGAQTAAALAAQTTEKQKFATPRRGRSDDVVGKSQRLTRENSVSGSNSPVDTGEEVFVVDHFFEMDNTGRELLDTIIRRAHTQSHAINSSQGVRQLRKGGAAKETHSDTDSGGDDGEDTAISLSKAQARLLNLVIAKDVARVSLELSRPDAQVNITVGSKKRTCLMVAAATGSIPMAKCLLEHGANIHEQDRDGDSCLHVAVDCEKEDFALFLLSGGASPSHVNNRGEDILSKAVQHVLPRLLVNLIKAGADVNQRDPIAGFRPLHFAARGGLLKISIALVNAGADMNAQKNDGWTPLHLAVSNNHEWLTMWLLLRGAGTNIPNHEKKLPIDIASPLARTWFDVLQLSRSERERLLNRLESRAMTVWRVGDDPPLRREVCIDDEMLGPTGFTHMDRVRLPDGLGSGQILGTCDGLLLIQLDDYRGAVAWGPADKTAQTASSGIDLIRREKGNCVRVGLVGVDGEARDVEIGTERCLGLGFLPDDRIAREGDPFTLRVVGRVGDKLMLQPDKVSAPHLEGYPELGKYQLRFRAGSSRAVYRSVQMGNQFVSMDVSSEASMPFMFFPLDRVLTPKGMATCLGVFENRLFFELDSDKTACTWGPYTWSSFISNGFVLIRRSGGQGTRQYTLQGFGTVAASVSVIDCLLSGLLPGDSVRDKRGCLGSVVGWYEQALWFHWEGDKVATTFKLEKWTLNAVRGLGLELLHRAGAPLQKSLVKGAASGTKQQTTKSIAGAGSKPAETQSNDLSLEVLFKAAAGGNVENVMQVLDAGLDVNTFHQDKNLLMVAAAAGKVNMVSMLLGEGANVNAIDSEGNTALVHACKKNHLRVAEALTEHPDVDVTVKNKQGAYALFFACALKNASVVEAMVQKGAKDQVNHRYNGQHPLHIAAQAQDRDTVLLLLRHVTDVDVLGPGNRTPLHVSCAYANVDVASALIEAGANPNAQMDSGITPLHLAVKEGRRGLTRLLVSHGADPNIPDASGRTPLSLASKAEIRDVLLERDVFPGPDEPIDSRFMTMPQTKKRTFPQLHWSELALGERIGSGGFGVVYKGNYQGKVVAIKKINAADIPADAMAEFNHEVEIMSQMSHPNIVNLIAASQEPSNMAIVSELCERRSLYHVLHDPNTKLNRRTKLKMAYDAASGMSYLHKSGIVHRDLKSLNLLVTDDFTVKVADFGLAKVKSIAKSVMTGSIHVMGTLAYMAPELLMGKPFNEKVDVYAFGIVLWEILTRENPFNGMSQDIIFHGVKSGTLKPEIPEGCPEGYAQLIRVCLEKQPNKRPTFQEIRSQLKLMQQSKHRD
eukprot:c12910_g1_i2.p1 GENE.c12910_g1_i2~~c12910_g1_i2.p1  ORF type:complete len:1642 (+),score=461.47 c12910_g1_i2:343-5268(+)